MSRYSCLVSSFYLFLIFNFQTNSYSHLLRLLFSSLWSLLLSHLYISKLFETIKIVFKILYSFNGRLCSSYRGEDSKIVGPAPSKKVQTKSEINDKKKHTKTVFYKIFIYIVSQYVKCVNGETVVCNKQNSVLLLSLRTKKKHQFLFARQFLK